MHALVSADKEFSFKRTAMPPACQPKRILIINQYFAPDRSATAGVLDRIVRIISSKVSVLVLAGRPSYMTSEKHPWRFFYLEKKQNVNILRVGSTDYNRYKLIKRLANYLTYCLMSIPLALAVKADLIFAMTDPPLAGFIGALAAAIKKKPFIYYIQDLHPDMAIAAGMIRAGLITKLWDRLHSLVLKRADKVIVIGEDMREKLLEKKIVPSHIVLIRHGSDLNNESTAIDEVFIAALRRGYSKLFIHAGNINNYGAWEKIAEAIQLVDNENIGFIFIGEGAKKEYVMKLCEKLKNVKFFPYQPREKVRSLLNAADVHIITIKQNLEGLVVPSKLYPILAEKKTILGICSEKSDAARIITKFGCGMIANPESSVSIADAIKLLSSEKTNLRVFEQRSMFAAQQLRQDIQLQLLWDEVKAFL